MTLIEVMVAMVILMIASMAIMQTAVVAYQNNAKNLIRDEAVRIADEQVNEQLNRPFDSLLSGVSPTVTLNRTVRNYQVAYDTRTTIAAIGSSDTRQIEVLVAWTFRGAPANHRVTTIAGKR
ncbi:MAG: type IV pilus modification PilV family protein [Nitrospirota bacterium]